MDILQFLQDYNVTYTTRGKNVGKGWYAVHCPWCGDDGFHGAFHNSGSRYYCWKCQGHSIERTLQKITGLSYYDFNNIIEQYDGTDSFYQVLNEKTCNKSSIELPGIPLIPYARKYLKKRKFDPDLLVEKYGLASGKVGSAWDYRILIPIYYQGKLVSWQGRTILDDPEVIRYKTLQIEESVMDAKSTLFNIDNCKEDYIGVNEGPFDTMRLGANFCATLGTSITESQIRMLAKYKRVVFVFDCEEQAQLRAKKYALRVAALGASAEVADLELGDRDPGDMTNDEVQEVKKLLDFA